MLMNMALSMQMAWAEDTQPINDILDSGVNTNTVNDILESGDDPNAINADKPPVAPPATSTGLSPSERLQGIGIETDLNSFTTGQHPDAPPDYVQPGVGAITSPILFVIDLIRYAMTGVAAIIIMIAAIKLISTGTEEEATKAKSTLIIGAIGLVVIQLAGVLVTKVFFGEQGQAFEDLASVEIYSDQGVTQIRGIIGFIEVFVGAIAVLTIVIRGFMLTTSMGDEEGIGKAKKHLLYAVAGLLIVGLSEVVIRGIIFPAAGEELPDVNKGKLIIVMISNFISGFIALASFVMLFYGGYKYVVSAGNEEETAKVKTTIIGATIGLLLALGAFAIINTLITFDTAVALSSVNLP